MADNTSKGAGGSSSSDAPTQKSAKKTSAKKTSTSTSRQRAPRAEPGRRMSGSEVAEAAARQLSELTSKDVEGVVGLQKSDEGWQVALEVLELRRIPTTTDVMATYEVSVDTSGELEGYRRVARYVRGQTEDGS